MSPRPPEIVLSEQERAELERLVRGYTTGQQLAVRARIVLAAGDGLNNSQIARWLDLDDETPGHWAASRFRSTDQPVESPRAGGRNRAPGHRRADLATACREAAQKRPTSS